jgi:metal-dependent hydrolase (beta-lactamase superfamily II)
MDDQMNITEFCKKLSLTDKRVELIGGFHFWMSNTKKVVKAAEDEFQQYFTDFCAMPA